MSDRERDTTHPHVKVRVEADRAVRFRVGTRWEVLASSVDSMWEGDYSVTLKEIEAKDDKV